MALFIAPRRPPGGGLLDPAATPPGGGPRGLLGAGPQIQAAGLVAQLLNTRASNAAGAPPAHAAAPRPMASAPAPTSPAAAPADGPPPRPRFFDFRGKAGLGRTDQLPLAGLNPGDKVITDGATMVLGPDRSPMVTLNPGYTGRRAAQLGPVLVPEAPPHASVDANMAQARAHRGDLYPQWFHDQVADRKPWDYKHSNGLAYAPFGNFNYGAAGREEQIDADQLFQMPGQVLKDAYTRECPQRPEDRPRPEWGSPGVALRIGKFGWGPPLPASGVGDNGDQPPDQYWIGQGLRYSDGRNPQPPAIDPRRSPYAQPAF